MPIPIKEQPKKYVYQLKNTANKKEFTKTNANQKIDIKKIYNIFSTNCKYFNRRLLKMK